MRIKDAKSFIKYNVRITQMNDAKTFLKAKCQDHTEKRCQKLERTVTILLIIAHHDGQICCYLRSLLVDLLGAIFIIQGRRPDKLHILVIVRTQVLEAFGD